MNEDVNNKLAAKLLTDYLLATAAVQCSFNKAKQATPIIAEWN